MSLLDRFRKQEPLLCNFCEWAMVILVVVSVVWRGGKSIDMTWVLTGVSMVAILVSYLHKHEDDGNSDVPLVIWGSLIGYILLTVTSFLLSTTQNYGFDEVLRTASLSFAMLWIMRKIGAKKQDDTYTLRLLRVFAATSIGACLVGILVYTFQPVNRFVGTFFDYRFQTDYWPNAWAQFLLLAWPIVLFLALKNYKFDEKKVHSRIQFLLRSLTVGFVVGCLLLSYSRGAIIAFVLQLLLWAGLVFYKTRPEFPARKVVPVGFVVAVVCLLTFASVNAMRSQVYAVQDVGAKVTFSANEGTSSISERYSFWTQSLRLGLQKPLLGWGPYSFRFVQPTLQNSVLATSDHPHNVLLKLFMERGVVALAAFALILYIILGRTLRQLLSKSTSADSLIFSLRTLMFISVCGVLAHNMIDYNLQFVGIALPFWLFLGVLMMYAESKEFTPVPMHSARFVEVSIAIVILLASLYEGSYLVISSLGRHTEATGDYEQALEWYGKASGEVFSRDLHLSRAQIFFAIGDYEQSQAAVNTYLKSNNEDFRAHKRLGETLLHDGQYGLALEAYKTAYTKGKFNDLGVVRGMLEAYLEQGREDAIENLKPELTALLSSYASAVQNNTHFIGLSPNVEEFIYIANLLSRLYPKEAPKYQVMAAKVDHNAQIERARIKARKPGFLW